MASIKWDVKSDCSKPVVVFFEDEGRFGRISKEMRCWVRKDMVPSVPRQMVREYIYAYSALSAQTGDCFSMISPYCNTECMNIFLHQLADHYKDYRIVLVLDKAGWHISRTIDLPPNLLLMHLPPYSPELNPVEILWREVRKKEFHNEVFDSLNDVEKVLVKILGTYHKDPEAIKQLAKGYSF